MSVQGNMAALFRLLGAITDGLDEYIIAAGQGDGAYARDIRRRCLVSLDGCFDLLDRSIEQCHGLAARRRADEPPPPVPNGGLH